MSTSSSAVTTNEYLATLYREAVKTARAVLLEKGANARYEAYKAASDYVAATVSRVDTDDFTRDKEALRSFCGQGSDTHRSWISEAVLCAELIGSLEYDGYSAVTDTVFLPDELFTDILPSIRGDIARKAFFWCVVLKAATGRCAVGLIELARVLRCPLQAVKKALGWLLDHEYIAFEQSRSAYAAIISERRRYFDLAAGDKTSCLTPENFRPRWNELSISGQSRVPVCLIMCYYDFDYAYWTQFSAAYKEPADLLAVLTKKEREEIIQLSTVLTNSHTGSKPSPMFMLELREIRHLAATVDEVSQDFTVLDDDPMAFRCPASTDAFQMAAMCSEHLTQVPVHGRNRRQRAYRRALDKTGPSPGWM